VGEKMMKRTFKIWCECGNWMVDLKHECKNIPNGVSITRIEGKCLCGKPEKRETYTI
jgi:hypothetical protein